MQGTVRTQVEWSAVKAILLFFVTNDCPVANSNVAERTAAISRTGPCEAVTEARGSASGNEQALFIIVPEPDSTLSESLACSLGRSNRDPAVRHYLAVKHMDRAICPFCVVFIVSNHADCRAI